jgi:hypothetical protein
MSISLSTPAPEQVRRLEAAAAARPGLYRSLRAGLGAEPAIAKAWLLEGQAQLATAKITVDLPVEALIIVVDSFDAQQKPTYADAVQARQQEVLAGLIGPGALAVVVSYYSTEPLPPALRTVLEHQPSGGIYPR